MATKSNDTPEGEAHVAKTKITVGEEGPYRVEGDVEVVDDEGRTIRTREGRAIYLCRCGESSTKPFCDGTHNDVGFSGEQAAVVEEAYAGS